MHMVGTHICVRQIRTPGRPSLFYFPRPYEKNYYPHPQILSKPSPVISLCINTNLDPITVDPITVRTLRDSCGEQLLQGPNSSSQSSARLFHTAGKFSYTYFIRPDSFNNVITVMKTSDCQEIPLPKPLILKPYQQ